MNRIATGESIRRKRKRKGTPVFLDYPHHVQKSKSKKMSQKQLVHPAVPYAMRITQKFVQNNTISVYLHMLSLYHLLMLILIKGRDIVLCSRLEYVYDYRIIAQATTKESRVNQPSEYGNTRKISLTRNSPVLYPITRSFKFRTSVSSN